MDTEKLRKLLRYGFTTVPHGKSNEIVKVLYERGMKIVDLSADFRLKNPKDYVKWYGWEHPFPELYWQNPSMEFLEFHRPDIQRAYCGFVSWLYGGDIFAS